MKVFTVSDGSVFEGVEVQKLTLKSTGTAIPVIQVGEEGRGRHLASLPIQLLPENFTKWQSGEAVIVRYVTLGTTKSGNPKLIEERGNTETLKAVVINRTGIGFRGCNYHTGNDFTGFDSGFFPLETEAGDEFKHSFKIIAQGKIAQGDAGKMGSGTQYIAIADAGKVFRSERTGRLYGDTGVHYYTFNGYDLLSATKEEREISDIF